MKTNVIHSIDKHVDEVLMALFLTGVITMMSVHVFFRYVLKSPLTWTEECTRYCFIWFVYSGIGYGVRNATHIRINILEIFFPKIVPAFSLIQTVITTAFFAYLIVPSIEVVVQTVQRNQFSPGMLNFSRTRPRHKSRRKSGGYPVSRSRLRAVARRSWRRMCRKRMVRTLYSPA